MNETLPRLDDQVEVDELVPSSGDIFSDLDLGDSEVEAHKVQLAKGLNEALKLRGRSQAQRARALGVAQPVVSDLERYELARYSLDRLVRYSKHLGIRYQLVPRSIAQGTSAEKSAKA